MTKRPEPLSATSRISSEYMSLVSLRLEVLNRQLRALTEVQVVLMQTRIEILELKGRLIDHARRTGKSNPGDTRPND